MSRTVRSGLLAALLTLLVGCGVRGQSKPERIQQPSRSPTPTPSLQHSTCPTPRSTPPSVTTSTRVQPPSPTGTVSADAQCEPPTETSHAPGK